MKVFVSAQAPDISAPLDPRFGRAAYFVTVDLETGAWAAEPNAAVAADHGAGIEAARFAVDRGAEAVITGAAGPNAFRTLQAAGVVIYLTSGGSVADAVDACRAGALPRADDASVPAHAGTGAGAGRGGMGRGPGQGMGRGQGMSRGQGQGGMGRGPGRAGGRSAGRAGGA